MTRVYAKIGTGSGEVVFARVKRRSRREPGRWAVPGDWLEIKRGNGYGDKWQGPLVLDEVRPGGGIFSCDGIHIMHWV